MVSSKEMLVKGESISKTPMKLLESCSTIPVKVRQIFDFVFGIS